MRPVAEVLYASAEFDKIHVFKCLRLLTFARLAFTLHMFSISKHLRVIMLSKRQVQELVFAGFSLAAFASAEAVPVTFDLAGAPYSSVSATSGCVPNDWCGVNAAISSSLDSVIGTLDVGETLDFHFLTLEFWGIGLGAGTIEATLAFDLPTAPPATGAGNGGFATVFGMLNGGFLEWSSIAPITLADGTSFLVEFQNLLGIDVMKTDVKGSITLLSGTAVAVPEPASVGLLGLGLAALLGAASQRKRA